MKEAGKMFVEFSDEAMRKIAAEFTHPGRTRSFTITIPRQPKQKRLARKEKKRARYMRNCFWLYERVPKRFWPIMYNQYKVRGANGIPLIQLSRASAEHLRIERKGQ